MGSWVMRSMKRWRVAETCWRFGSGSDGLDMECSIERSEEQCKEKSWGGFGIGYWGLVGGGALEGLARDVPATGVAD
jgi:hypothetical protein